MNPVWITATNAVTGLGGNLETSWERLLRAETAIERMERFSTENYKSHVAACVKGLEFTGEQSLPHDLLGRLFAPLERLPRHTVLITASTKGGVNNPRKPRGYITTDFREMLPAGMPDFVADQLGILRGGINISAACASSAIAIAHGAAMIANGATDTVLVCGFDLVTEFIFSGFNALQALSPEPCRPFDKDRMGMSVGEGAAYLVLMTPAQAIQAHKTPLAVLMGWGAANDASHITAPAPDGCGLTLAIRKALTRANLAPEAVGGISAHGTGTISNDRMELASFRDVFGQKIPPLHSVKGAIGHTMGGAGAIEAALAIKSLETGTIPPTVGVVTPEAGAEGCVSAEPSLMTANTILSTNSGFGGINAALLLGPGRTA